MFLGGFLGHIYYLTHLKTPVIELSTTHQSCFCFTTFWDELEGFGGLMLVQPKT